MKTWVICCKESVWEIAQAECKNGNLHENQQLDGDPYDLLATPAYMIEIIGNPFFLKSVRTQNIYSWDLNLHYHVDEEYCLCSS